MSRGKRRPVAGRDEILVVSLAIGVREGWQSVTIRSVAQELGYASPLLYEYFENKEDLLTQIAANGLVQLETALVQDLSADSPDAVSIMAERYWNFVLTHVRLYRLMNGMDGPLIDNKALGQASQSICSTVARFIHSFLGKKATDALASSLADELWALLHGMAALHLDREIPFDVQRVTRACLKLLEGTRLASVRDESKSS